MEEPKEQEQAVGEVPVVASSSTAVEVHDPSNKRKKNKKKKKKKKIDTSQDDPVEVGEAYTEDGGEQEEAVAVVQQPSEQVAKVCEEETPLTGDPGEEDGGEQEEAVAVVQQPSEQVAKVCEEETPQQDKVVIKSKEVPSSYLSDAAKAWGGISSLTGDETFETVEKYTPYQILKDMRAEDGLDMTKKEYYLEPQEFSKVFGMDMQTYLRLPLWRRQMLKKNVGLF